MSTLERAIQMAAEGHSGQTDKGGAPYVLHPLRVMLGVTTNEERIVAVLNDLVEDCPGWSFERLREEGFSERVLTALASVTSATARSIRTSSGGRRPIRSVAGSSSPISATIAI